MEDITTGEVLSVTDVGNPDRDISIPTEFDNLVVNGSLTLNVGSTIEITGPASTSGFGPVKLANIKLTESTAVAGSNADIDSNGPSEGVVTPRWLNKWKIDNNILSAPDRNVNIYVDPINGMDMSLSDLSENPPTVPSQAVKTLRSAAKYANTVFGQKPTSPSTLVLAHT